MNTTNGISALTLDARHAVRAVHKDLRLFGIAVLIVGLGVGACTAVFSVLNPLMLRALPVDGADRLVWIANDGEGSTSAVTSRTGTLRDFRALSQSFDGITGYFAFFEGGSDNLVGDGEPVRLIGADVAHDFLEVLGVQPPLGRGFVEEEGYDDGPSVVVISHGLWMRQFGADPGIVGRSISLNDEPTEVVGVLPSSFDFASLFAPHTRVDFLRPFPISDATDAWGNTLSMIGRLAPGATVASAQMDLHRVIETLERDDPERRDLGAVVTGLQSKVAGPYRSALLLLAAAAGAVMLIVCVNLSNLLLANGARRKAEMAVRSALGAPRARLIRQMMIESVLLAGGGAVVGAALAVIVTRLVAGAEGFSIPLLDQVAVDGQSLLFSAGLALVVGVVVGIVPALDVSSGSEAAAFRGSRRGMSASRRSTRLREGLVVAEIALACVLLVFGGLLLRSFKNVLDVDLGFRSAELVAWQLDPSRRFESLPERVGFFDQMVAKVEAIPGVVSAGLTDAKPLGRNRIWPLSAPGTTYEGGVDAFGAFPHVVDHRYVQTMEIALVSGRFFTAQDTLRGEPVVILNETAARKILNGDDPLGREAIVGRDLRRVVGIVADIRHRSLEDSSGPQMYLPVAQSGDFQALDLVVRSSLSPEALAASVSTARSAVDPAMPTRDFQTIDSVVADTVSPRRFTLQLLVGFAATALLLAALGVYGVLSCVVAERIPEIGIRLALGETNGGVLRRVVGRTLVLAALGLILGAAGAAVVSRWVGSLLYDVEASDPRTFLVVATLMMLVAGLAGWVPALRASRTSAASVLRQ